MNTYQSARVELYVSFDVAKRLSWGVLSIVGLIVVGARGLIVGTWLLPLLQHQLASHLTASSRVARTRMSARRVHRDSFDVIEHVSRCALFIVSIMKNVSRKHEVGT